MQTLKIAVVALALAGLSAPAAFADKDDKGQGRKHVEQQMKQGDDKRENRKPDRDDDDEIKSEERRHGDGRGDFGNDDRNMKGRGEDAGEEMRERHEERRQIMEETKTRGKKDETEKGKKPWWKFWQREEGAAAE